MIAVQSERRSLIARIITYRLGLHPDPAEAKSAARALAVLETDELKALMQDIEEERRRTLEMLETDDAWEPW